MMLIWREHRRLLLILGTILLINVGFFLTYRVRYQQRVEDLEQRHARAESDLLRAQNARRAAERQLASYREVERGIQRVYNESWSTPDERLTPLILEIRSLARKSDLEPTSVSYDRSADTRESGASTMNISFGVKGTYSQVRRLINLIELSKQFVVIDEIALGESGESDATVGLRISLKTIFRYTGDGDAGSDAPGSKS